MFVCRDHSLNKRALGAPGRERAVFCGGGLNGFPPATSQSASPESFLLAAPGPKRVSANSQSPNGFVSA